MFGAVAIVVVWEYWLIKEIRNLKFKIQKDKFEEIKKYGPTSQKKLEEERLAQTKEKTGVDTTLKAIYLLISEEIPIWVADYVLGWYGEGAVMVVSAHNERDYDFTEKFNLPIKTVIIDS